MKTIFIKQRSDGASMLVKEHIELQQQAAQIVADLLANEYPHDLMAIRREVEREWCDEQVAREEMDAYCTQEFMMEARQKWKSAKAAAQSWLEGVETASQP